MSFTTFDYTKSWKNPEDFPTFEDDETQVRADMQDLFDQAKVGLNTVVGELNDSSAAESVGFTSDYVAGANVKAAIEKLYEDMQDIVDVGVTDGAVTTAKLHDDAVTADKIADGAVGTAALAASGVTTAKLADNSVTSAKIVDGTIVNADIADGTITAAKIADNEVAKLVTVGEGQYKVSPVNITSAVIAVGANKTLASTDNRYFFRVTASSTITVPDIGSAGYEVEICNTGAGTVKIVPGTGVNIYLASSSTVLTEYTVARYEYVRLKKTQSNTFLLEGNAIVPPGSIKTAELASNAVTTAKITDANVTTDKIADANVTADKLASNAVTTDKITDANVTTDKIADANVTADKLASNAVTTAKITDANVTTDKIAANAITTAKLNSDVYGTASPNMNGTASAGAAGTVTVSKSDHVHPHDTYSTGLILNYDNNVYASLPSTSGQTKGRIIFVLV